MVRLGRYQMFVEMLTSCTQRYFTYCAVCLASCFLLPVGPFIPEIAIALGTNATEGGPNMLAVIFAAITFGGGAILSLVVHSRDIWRWTTGMLFPKPYMNDNGRKA